MKTLLALVLLLSGGVAEARDTRLMIGYEESLVTGDAKAKLGDDVKFFYGSNAPKSEKDLGEYTANKKTNAFNKSDEIACKWAFLSAMISLRDRARQLGADSVVLKSNYKQNLVEKSDKYECGAGALMAGVTLVGKFYKTK